MFFQRIKEFYIYLNNHLIVCFQELNSYEYLLIDVNMTIKALEEKN